MPSYTSADQFQALLEIMNAQLRSTSTAGTTTWIPTPPTWFSESTLRFTSTTYAWSPEPPMPSYSPELNSRSVDSERTRVMLERYRAHYTEGDRWREPYAPIPASPTHRATQSHWGALRRQDNEGDRGGFVRPLFPECECHGCAEQAAYALENYLARTKKKREAVRLLAEQGRAWGVEIECAYPNRLGGYTAFGAQLSRDASITVAGFHERYHSWELHSDSTIRAGSGYQAVEVVSRILRGEEGISELRRTSEALKAMGAEARASCGLHVHVGIEDLSLAQKKNLAANFMAHEHLFDMVIPARRLRNPTCKSNLGRREPQAAIKRLMTDAHSYDGLLSLSGGHEKYLKLNMAHFGSTGTVEFRGHPGSVDPEAIETWVRFVLAFVEWAKDASPPLEQLPGKSETAFLNFLHAIKVDLKARDYLHYRRRVLVRAKNAALRAKEKQKVA